MASERDPEVAAAPVNRSQPQLVNPQLAAALAHPTRAHSLTVLSQRPASPRELAEELGVPTRHVAYHIKRLEELGCVELAESKPVRGGRVVEHIYRATQRSYFDADSWERLTDQQKRGVVTTYLRLSSDDVNEAILAGTIYEPDDNHISRTVMSVDGEGWQELIEVLDRAVGEVLQVQERIAERTAGQTDSEMMLAKVLILHFRAPEGGRNTN
ncbi:MAG: winged helix-turn-helix domain-containing protein [Solirubrobacterales bacterium]